MSAALEPVITPCGHTFCTDCITYWLNQKEAGTVKRCPSCRQGLRQFSRQLSFSDELPAAWRAEGGDAQDGDGGEDQEEEDLTPLAVGDRVDADYGEWGTLYIGTIATVNADRTYAITYDDGDFEASVKRKSIQTQSGQ
jgi:hypothetical protein